MDFLVSSISTRSSPDPELSFLGHDWELYSALSQDHDQEYCNDSSNGSESFKESDAFDNFHGSVPFSSSLPPSNSSGTGLEGTCFPHEEIRTPVLRWTSSEVYTERSATAEDLALSSLEERLVRSESCPALSGRTKEGKHKAIRNPRRPTAKQAGQIRPSSSVGDLGDLTRRRTKEKQVKIEHLAMYFTSPLQTAAKQMGVCATTLKKICRKEGIKRWPHRKIRKVNRSIERLQGLVCEMPGEEKEQITQEISALERSRQSLLRFRHADDASGAEQDFGRASEPCVSGAEVCVDALYQSDEDGQSYTEENAGPCEDSGRPSGGPFPLQDEDVGCQPVPNSRSCPSLPPRTPVNRPASVTPQPTQPKPPVRPYRSKSLSSPSSDGFDGSYYQQSPNSATSPSLQSLPSTCLRSESPGSSQTLSPLILDRKAANFPNDSSCRPRSEFDLQSCPGTFCSLFDPVLPRPHIARTSANKKNKSASKCQTERPSVRSSSPHQANQQMVARSATSCSPSPPMISSVREAKFPRTSPVEFDLGSSKASSPPADSPTNDYFNDSFATMVHMGSGRSRAGSFSDLTFSHEHSFITKAALGDHLVRFKFPSHRTLGELHEEVSEAFSQVLGLSHNFSLKYRDDEGDWVTMNREQDWQECKQLAQRSTWDRIYLVVDPGVSASQSSSSSTTLTA